MVVGIIYIIHAKLLQHFNATMARTGQRKSFVPVNSCVHNIKSFQGMSPQFDDGGQFAVYANNVADGLISLVAVSEFQIVRMRLSRLVNSDAHDLSAIKNKRSVTTPIIAVCGKQRIAQFHYLFKVHAPILQI